MTFRSLVKLLFLFVVIWGLSWLYSSFNATVLSWLRYEIHERGLSGCTLRASPYIQVIGTQCYAISWVTTCEIPERDIEFVWGLVKIRAEDAGRNDSGRKVIVADAESIAACIENTIGSDGIEHIKLDGKQHLYTVRLLGVPEDRIVNFHVKAFGSKYPGSIVVLPALTGAIPPPSPPLISPIEIAIVGDNQFGRDVFTKICKMICAKQPHLFVHLGDMVQRAWKAEDWQKQFFDPIGWRTQLSYTCPMLLVHGNHDTWAKGSKRSKYLSFPADTYKTYSETNSYEPSNHYYHAVSFGPIRWIVIDSNEETDAQAQWLEAELSRQATQKAPFRIVLCHIPPFIEYWNPRSWAAGESSWPIYVRNRLQPLFEKYRVDLVLSGHQHNYQRGLHNGVNYITSGGAGGPLDSDRVEEHFVFKTTLLEHHYLMMSASRAGLAIRVHSINDKVLDSFYIPRSVARKLKPSEMQ